MAKRADIVAKAYACIDEAYPDGLDQKDAAAFRVEAFVDEAIRFVGLMAPVHALGEGDDFSDNSDLAGSIELPNGFVRLISFKMKDWTRAVSKAYYDDSPLYAQQQNAVLKGSKHRPKVFICKGGTTLEYYSSDDQMETAQAFVVSGTIDYPEALSDAIAWKTAELVLSMMNDAQGVQFAQAQLQQIMQAL